MVTVADVAALRPTLGADAAERLVEVLSRHTTAIAEAFAGRPVAIVADVAAAMRQAAGPVIVLAADVPRVREVHLQLAMSDLGSGADVAVGPTFDGGYYLIAMQAPQSELISGALGEGPGAAGTGALLAAVQGAGLEVGLLRMERALRSPADADAMLADPLLPFAVREALSGWVN